MQQLTFRKALLSLNSFAASSTADFSSGAIDVVEITSAGKNLLLNHWTISLSAGRAYIRVP